MRILTITGLVLLLASATSIEAADDSRDLFESRIRPLLIKHCLACRKGSGQPVDQGRQPCGPVSEDASRRKALDDRDRRPVQVGTARSLRPTYTDGRGVLSEADEPGTGKRFLVVATHCLAGGPEGLGPRVEQRTH